MGESAKKNIAINGFGRIGRCVLRALYERPELQKKIAINAVNEPAEANTIAHLLKYDSTHGRLPFDVSLKGQSLLIDQQPISLSHHESIERCQWNDIDLVMECSGRFSDVATAQQHLDVGANKVMFSQPAEADVEATIVFGVNQQSLQADYKIISAASCTTNAIAPVLQALDAAIGVEAGTITTLHSAMNDQPVIDAYHHTDLRKTRSAMHSMIPVDTELAKGVTRILPQFRNKLIAQAVRVPTMNVSALDVSLRLSKSRSTAEVLSVLQQAQVASPNIIALSDEPLASCDFNHDAHSAIVDTARVQIVDGSLLKLFIWFDNEWGYANRMLDIAEHWLDLDR